MNEQVSDTEQRITTDGTQGRVVQFMRYAADAVLLVSYDLQGGISKSFRPNPPVVFAPIPTALGASWEWTMTSNDAQPADRVTIHQASTVTRAERITIAGQLIETFVVESTATLTGWARGTIRLTTWLSPAHAMGVRIHEVSNVTALIFNVQSDTTSELVSLTPS